MKKYLKFILGLVIICVFFYFFSFQSAWYFFNYYRAAKCGNTAIATIDNKTCHVETSAEYAPQEYCDIYYSFEFNNNTYKAKINFVNSSKCENIGEGQKCAVAFLKSNPEKSFIIGFYEYSKFWTIVKLVISVIALPFLLYGLSAYFLIKEKKGEA